MNPVFPVPPASSAPIANQRPNDPIVEPNLQPNDQLPLRIRARIKKPRIHVEEPKTKESGLEQRQGISTWKIGLVASGGAALFAGIGAYAMKNLSFGAILEGVSLSASAHPCATVPIAIGVLGSIILGGIAFVQKLISN